MYLRIPTPEKVGTWWDLNPHCSGGRRCNHITRIRPLAKCPKLGGVTAICRGSMTGIVLTRQLKGKNWERVGFEHTPIEYRESYATLCVIMLLPSTPNFMSLLPSIAAPIQEKYWNIHWQILRTGEIWTHTRRITWMCEPTALCVMICFLSTISFASVLLSIAVQAVKKCFLIRLYRKIWHLVGFEPTLFGRSKSSPHYAY